MPLKPRLLDIHPPFPQKSPAPPGGRGGRPPRPAGHNEFRLTEGILALSAADNWDDAKCEWEIAELFRTDPDEPRRCLCGHAPIHKCCDIRNHQTGHTAIVGSVCVKNFLGLPADKVFAGLDRIERNLQAALTPEAVDYSYDNGWINKWELNFYRDSLRRHLLSTKQRATRVRINTKVLRCSTAGVGRKIPINTQQ